MENGVLLGWLIDPERRTVTISRPGAEPETRENLASLAGAGPVDGFTLDLAPIWA